MASTLYPKTQWDAFATQYSSLEDLPGEIVAAHQLRRTLGSIQGFKILDLACGTGLYGRMALSMGATRIVGVDVAADMVDAGIHISKSQGLADRMAFHVSDCSAPLDALDLGQGEFDLVMGNWLLSYAADRAELEGMWRNIAIHLKPGGKFVGLMGTLDPHAASSNSGKYGMKTTVTGEIENGFTVHAEAITEPKIEFDAYHLHWPVHEEAAKKASMIEVQYTQPQKEDLPEAPDMEYWQEMLEAPYFVICTAKRYEL